MRDIKFRAWVRRYEILNHPSGTNEIIRDKMVPITGLHFFEGDELTEISIDTEEVGEIQNILLEDHGTSISVMQYTGLKDAGGQEISEGDIIEHTGYDSKPQAVEYECGGFYAGFETFPEKCWRYKVIGNIYENPELLE
jgi:uncharacterized phage protein (TIGR01671 family)